jgi:hypothetical protein
MTPQIKYPIIYTQDIIPVSLVLEVQTEEAHELKAIPAKPTRQGKIPIFSAAAGGQVSFLFSHQSATRRRRPSRTNLPFAAYPRFANPVSPALARPLVLRVSPNLFPNKSSNFRTQML